MRQNSPKWLTILIISLGLSNILVAHAELVTIRITAENAKSVKMAGSYDGWQQPRALTSIGDGIWQKRIDLPAGRYEYQFLIDGKWQTNSDEATITNGFGDLNNILIVHPQ
jgi:hypothetical protein